MTETERGHSVDNERSQSSTGNDDSTPLRRLCADLHAQVTAFLQEDVPTERLKNVQAQCQNSLSIISEAMKRYPYILPPWLLPNDPANL